MPSIQTLIQDGCHPTSALCNTVTDQTHPRLLLDDGTHGAGLLVPGAVLVTLLQDGGHQAGEGHVQHVGHGSCQEVNIHRGIVNQSLQGTQVFPPVTLGLEAEKIFYPTRKYFIHTTRHFSPTTWPRGIFRVPFLPLEDLKYLLLIVSLLFR